MTDEVIFGGPVECPICKTMTPLHYLNWRHIEGEPEFHSGLPFQRVEYRDCLCCKECYDKWNEEWKDDNG